MLSPLSPLSSMYFVLLSPHLYRSSFAPSARLPESPVHSGLYCPNDHRLRDRLYTNSGRHCDECETPLEDGDAGKWCQVVCCATQSVVALCHSMFQRCDYDVCAECAVQLESSPLLPRHAPPGNLAAVQASAGVATTLSPSHHPGRQQPFAVFLLPAAAPQVSHEALFNAAASPLRPFGRHTGPAPAPQVSHEALFNAAASPLRPFGRHTGRLRLRVSTPQQLLVEVTSVPRLQRRPKVVSSPFSSRLACILEMNTPPRVGFPGFVPCQLFPDSPIRSPLLVHQSVGTDVLAFCDAGVQTDCETPAPTSPRLDQPATLRDVRNELRALLIGLGF